MTVKDLQTRLANLDPNLPVYVSDPNRGSVIYPLTSLTIETVNERNQFVDDDYSNYGFPLGFQFVDLY